MLSVCIDKDCPKCGLPETYAEGETAPERVGCRHCGWTKKLRKPKPPREV